MASGKSEWVWAGLSPDWMRRVGVADTASPRDDQCPRGELSVDGIQAGEGEVSLPS